MRKKIKRNTPALNQQQCFPSLCVPSFSKGLPSLEGKTYGGHCGGAVAVAAGKGFAAQVIDPHLEKTSV